MLIFWSHVYEPISACVKQGVKTNQTIFTMQKKNTFYSLCFGPYLYWDFFLLFKNHISFKLLLEIGYVDLILWEYFLFAVRLSCWRNQMRKKALKLMKLETPLQKLNRFLKQHKLSRTVSLVLRLRILCLYHKVSSCSSKTGSRWKRLWILWHWMFVS